MSLLDPTDRRDLLRATAALGLVLFAAFTVDQVLRGPIYQADFPVYAWTDRLVAQGVPIHIVGNWMSLAGSSLVDAPLLIAATIVLWRWKRRDLAWLCLGGGAVIGWLNPVLKGLIQRPLPPYIAHRFPHSYAYPSGHTMGAMGTLGVAILLLAEGHIWRKGLLDAEARQVRRWAVGGWLTLSFIVGAGRILAQHHWLSDVLAAWALSPALVCVTLLLARAAPAKAAPRRTDPAGPDARRWAIVLVASTVLCGAILADTWFKGPFSAPVIAFNDHIAAWQQAGAPTAAWGAAFSQLGEPDVDLFVVAMATLACLLLGSPRRALVLVLTAAAGAWLILALQGFFLGHNVSVLLQQTPVVQDGQPVRIFFPGRYSHMFPSGHAFGAALDFGLAFVLVAEAWIDTSALPAWRAHGLRRWALGLWVLAIVACGSGRLLLRVHWYTDVLAGATLGIALVAVAVLLSTRRWRPA